MLFRKICLVLLLAGFLPVIAFAQNDDAGPGEDNGTEEQEPAVAPGTAKRIEIKAPYVLIDAGSGDVLAEDRAGEPWYPASLSKLMTAYVVFHKIREGKLRLDQEISVSALASGQEPSKIGIPVGKTVTVDFALQALLTYSANDIAYVLAEGASGSIAGFADDMNAAARRLGLTATHYVNPNGLFDPRQITSARDLAVLSAVMLTEFPEHAHFFRQEYLVIGKRKLPNRNRLIRTMPEADGMKTGFVCASGFNLVASASRNGRKLIAVVLGYKNSFTRAEAARALLERGFAMAAPPGGKKVADIINMPQGTIVPADMTTLLCKNKSPVSIKDGTTLAGWGVTFGTYNTGQKADMALRGRLLNPYGINIKAYAGVVALPRKAGFGAWMWNLDKVTSEEICRNYATDGAHCQVIAPEVLAQMAANAKVKRESEAAMSQGSDDAATAVKPVRTVMRRISH